MTYLRESRLDKPLLHVVKPRADRINGRADRINGSACRIDTLRKDARAAGAGERALRVLAPVDTRMKP